MTSAVDVLVVGAGIQGAGVAQAAAAAGYSVRVLEKTGVASATSSRSSKLIHGGLRYLETGQFGLVRECLRERDILLRIAPQLVRRVAFHIPIYRRSRRGTWKIRAGLSLYAALNGLQHASWYSSVPRRQWADLDGLNTIDLDAVFRYYDAQTDDAALTQAVMRSAQRLEAELVCPGEFLGAQRTPSGFRVQYRAGDVEMECTTTTLVNAAGPWGNEVLARIHPRFDPPAVELVQGTHLVLDGVLQQGIYYTEADDGRAVFVMSWHGQTLIGTTETAYHGDPAQTKPLAAEENYLLRTFQQYFPRRPVHVRDRFAGLRVLPRTNAAAFDRPRETLYMTETTRGARLVGIYGGKLTSYRASALKALDVIRPVLPQRAARADTAFLELND